MLPQSESIAKNYLTQNGYSGNTLQEVLSGFDFRFAIYEQQLFVGDVIYQFVRTPSAGDLSPRLGNWFCRPGATLDSLAVISGGAGRIAAKVKVVCPVVALEGTASPQNVNWSWSGGGSGGGTQSFLPSHCLMYAVTVVGFQLDVRGVIQA